MAGPIQFGSPRRAVRALSELTGLPVDRCAKLIDALYSRKPGLRWLPPLAAPIAFLGWMFIFGRVTDALEGTRWDILAFLQRADLLGFVGMLLLGYGVAIILAVVVGATFPQAVLRRLVIHHLYSPTCFWCGYSLRGLERHNAAIDCPECGKSSPVRYTNEMPSS